MILSPEKFFFFKIALKKHDIVRSVFVFPFFLSFIRENPNKIIVFDCKNSTPSQFNKIDRISFFFRTEIRKSTTIIKWTILFVSTYVRSFVGYNRRSHKIVGR